MSTREAAKKVQKKKKRNVSGLLCKKGHLVPFTTSLPCHYHLHPHYLNLIEQHLNTKQQPHSVTCVLEYVVSERVGKSEPSDFVSHEAVISYQFGKVRYILTENLFARYVMKDAQISQKCKHMLQVKYETLWLVTRS